MFEDYLSPIPSVHNKRLLANTLATRAVTIV